MRARRLLPVVICFLALTCVDNRTLTAPRFAGPRFEISDGRHSSGDPHFFFLPPLVSDPKATGDFDPEFLPYVRVEVCEWTGTACLDPPVAVFMAEGTPPSRTLRLDTDDEQYIATWKTSASNLDPAKTYRIRVLVRQVELGHVDVDVISSRAELAEVDWSRFAPLVKGRMLPIKFRIEEEVRGAVVIDDDGGTVRGKEGTPAERARLEIPPDAFETEALVTLFASPDPSNFERSVVTSALGGAVLGPVLSIESSNPNLAKPGILTIPYDPSALPPGASPANLLVVSRSEAGVLEVVSGGFEAESPQLDIDEATGTLSVGVLHFNDLAPVLPKPPSERADSVANVGCSMGDGAVSAYILDDQDIIGSGLPRRTSQVDLIVLHSTDSPTGQSLDAVINYGYLDKNCPAFGLCQANYYIDRDGTVFRLVAEDFIALHAVDRRSPQVYPTANETSVGIELLQHLSKDKTAVADVPAFTDDQYASLRSLLRGLLQRHKGAAIEFHKTLDPINKADPRSFDSGRIADLAACAFSDGFEASSGWIPTGFWNRSTLTSSDGMPLVNKAFPTHVDLPAGDASSGMLPNASEGSFAFWYGRSSAGNFLGEQVAGDTPKSGGTSVSVNSGVLTSPAITIPPGQNQKVILSFDSWFEIESVDPSGFDIMSVAVRDTATGVVTSLGVLNPSFNSNGPASAPFTSGGFDAPPVWVKVTQDLSAFHGKTIQLRFAFDTGDELYNGFRGWLIDNVTVTVEPGTAPVSSLQAVTASRTLNPEPSVARRH